MTESFRKISSLLARRVKLVMSDVDGTLSIDGSRFEPVVVEAIHALQQCGMNVGLASGRPLSRLETVAALLGVDGPLIAENGGVATMSPGGEVLDFGYSRQTALEALRRLKVRFPSAIHELPDNKDRLVDVTIRVDGVPFEALQREVAGMQLLDSGYMIHIMAQGISKGCTLMRLLGSFAGGSVSPEEVMVFGDSSTDSSLFEQFPHSVLVLNPLLSTHQKKEVDGLTAYTSESDVHHGFAEVAWHIVKMRAGEA